MGIIVKFYLITILIINLLCYCDGQKMRKEAYMTVPDMISTAGYPIEKHRAVTEDGYILQLHRIPAGRRTARRSDRLSSKRKKAVLICHGLLGQSGDFIVMGPERSLGFILADAGYDVWLGNLRGNVYSSHQNLTKNDPDFWDYSFHEHGRYDLPALIDKVLEVTKLEKLLYIGYSMGTTIFFTMMSQRPEYNEKVISFVALAPAVYLDNIKPLAELALKTVNVPHNLRSQGVMTVNVSPQLRQAVIDNFCNFQDPQQDICYRFIYSIVGEDFEQTDWDFASVVLTRFQPASWRQLEHFGKIAMTGVFTSWEDGLWGAVKPYNLTNVKVPVLLVYGQNDLLTDKYQIKKLASILKSTGVLEALLPSSSWHKFNHLDFVFAKDVGKLFNVPLVKYIDNLYNKYGPM